MFDCALFITVYANSDNAAGTKLAPPASDSIKLPIICTFACCVIVSPAKFTTATTEFATNALPMSGNCVILIDVWLAVAIKCAFYYCFTKALMQFSAIYRYLHNM